MTCILLSASAMGQAESSVETSFHQFMELALKSPSSYGFANKDEALRCKLGRCYAFYSTTEWTEAYPQMPSQNRANPELAPEKVYEINTPAGDTRCTFVLARQPGADAFKPVMLGRQDIAEKLQILSALPSRDRLVLILDVAQKKLLYADVSNPSTFLTFP